MFHASRHSTAISSTRGGNGAFRSDIMPSPFRSPSALRSHVARNACFAASRVATLPRQPTIDLAMSQCRVYDPKRRTNVPLILVNLEGHYIALLLRSYYFGGCVHGHPHDLGRIQDFVGDPDAHSASASFNARNRRGCAHSHCNDGAIRGHSVAADRRLYSRHRTADLHL